MKTTASNQLTHVPLTVWTGLLFAIALDTAVQMIWKILATHIPEGSGLIPAVKFLITQPYFYCLLILFTAQFLCWMIVLAKADLTYAQPFTSLSLVTVAVSAAVLFNEHIGAMRMAGIAMIIIGVWLTSGTDHKTTNRLPTSDAASSGTL
jgi:drug/metabolite transporter (DMT)-like permease